MRTLMPNARSEDKKTDNIPSHLRLRKLAAYAGITIEVAVLVNHITDNNEAIKVLKEIKKAEVTTTQVQVLRSPTFTEDHKKKILKEILGEDIFRELDFSRGKSLENLISYLTPKALSRIESR